MPVRRPTLEEWFIGYQLAKISQNYHHLSFFAQLDVTALAGRYEARNERPPWTAIAAKAMGLAAIKVPAANRMLLRTPIGDRIIEFGHVSVNLPYLVEENGKKHLAAALLRDVGQRKVSEIDAQIRGLKQTKLDDTKLTKIVARRNNTFLNRMFLKLVHLLAYSFPRAVEKRSGGLSLSTVRTSPQAPLVTVAPFAPTAIALGLTDVRTVAGRVLMHVGIGYNHSALDGMTARLYVDALGAVLSADDAWEELL